MLTAGQTVFLDGRDLDATVLDPKTDARMPAPLTRMRVPLRENPFPVKTRPVGWLKHGDQVTVVDVKQGNGQYHPQILIRCGEKEGWVSDIYVSDAKHDAVGDELFV